MSNAPTRSTGSTKKAASKGKVTIVTLKEVRKRDGTVVPFDKERVKSAIYRAMLACEEGSEADAEKVMLAVVAVLDKETKERKDYLPTVEDVQDIVDAEMTRILSDESLHHLILKK